MSGAANLEKVFLSAEWRDLVLLNFIVAPEILQPHVPKGTALSFFERKTYLSLVGFRFCKTKLWGRFVIPFHAEFEEVNLRFYVQRDAGNEARRGVVFIKEIVPKAAIALTARWVYGENYISLPMRHTIDHGEKFTEVEYSWKKGSGSFQLLGKSSSEGKLPTPGSLEQYITEHYWGYSRQKDGSTVEYRVAHVAWEVSACHEVAFLGATEELYGREFGAALSRPPDSAYFARGSYVEVFEGHPID